MVYSGAAESILGARAVAQACREGSGGVAEELGRGIGAESVSGGGEGAHSLER
jgi:hypothetical protein